MINELKCQLLQEAGHNDKIIIITVDDLELYDAFSCLGERYICGGISECNIVGVAAGMSACGYLPYVIAGGTFLAFRAAEFIRNEVCLQKLKVNFVGIGAGLAISYLGSTHHCTEDIGILRSIPSLRIATPATPKQVRDIISYASDCLDSTYVRVGRACGELADPVAEPFSAKKIQIIQKGKDAVLFSSGSILCDAQKVVERLRTEGFDVGLVNMHTMMPVDVETLKMLSKQSGNWISVEEHNINSGIGSILADTIIENKWNVNLIKIGINNGFSVGHGSYDEIKKMNGLDQNIIYEKCRLGLHAL